MSSYPTSDVERDQWILARRPAREDLDYRQPYAFLVEEEYSAAKEVVPVATVFLTNRECPWRCVMCDLWRNTLTEKVPVGAIPQQIDYALARLPPARQIKLYNSGSFFDRGAIPIEDYPAIAAQANSFDRTIVESHPSLINQTCLQFRDLLSNKLEVAMGLETSHPKILTLLNKRITLNQFSDASQYLQSNGIDLRVFILVQPPFMRAHEALYWAERSLDFAFDCGATAVTLIPTRPGNGAMETLIQLGEFSPPKLNVVEAAASYGLRLGRGRVFVDLWDLHSAPSKCSCYPLRMERLRKMNLQQSVTDRIECPQCKGNS
ncbi:radical SAM protein [Edaphobacter dinghuensis]|uniref:radical SAM protein n=1 Tax=Edaphobacter dinghuensis TaxID=1560005 RepID=UPI001668A6B3|nr:radical SAM protein [Edaphobacter dinghuensis]